MSYPDVRAIVVLLIFITSMVMIVRNEPAGLNETVVEKYIVIGRVEGFPVYLINTTAGDFKQAICGEQNAIK